MDGILANDPYEGQYYVGAVFEKDGCWYIDRWMREDGPFDTQDMAEAHKVKLTEALESRERKAHEEACARWDARKRGH